jgi:hypothetical protein
MELQRKFGVLIPYMQSCLPIRSHDGSLKATAGNPANSDKIDLQMKDDGIARVVCCVRNKVLMEELFAAGLTVALRPTVTRLSAAFQFLYFSVTNPLIFSRVATHLRYCCVLHIVENAVA